MKKLLFVILLLCLAPSAKASLVTVELVGVGDSIPYHGVWAGYYLANVDGIEKRVTCEDFTTWVRLGQSWQAYEYTYADIQAGASTKFLGAQKYSEVGWLFSQMASAIPVARAQMQGAMWNIMSPGSVTMDSLAQSYYNQATDGTHNAFDFSGVGRVLTPNPYRSGQEFFVETAPVPLPAGMLLFMSGLVGIGGFIRKIHH